MIIQKIVRTHNTLKAEHIADKDLSERELKAIIDLVKKKEKQPININKSGKTVSGTRECTDHVIVLNEAHLKNILCSYFVYYHSDRTHLSLEKDSPDSRPMQPRPVGKCKIIALPRMGGLHHLDKKDANLQRY